MTCEQRRDLLLLYVSDALEADEKQDLRQHLTTGCPACSGYLAEAEATVNSIPFALNPMVPPVGLKQRLMDRIDAAEKKPAAISNMQITTDSFPIRLFRILVPAAVAASVAFVVTYAFMNAQVQKVTMDGRDFQRDAQASQKLMDQQAQQIDFLRQKFESQTQVVGMLRLPDVKIVHLKPGDQQPAAVANVLWDQKSRRWELLATGMKPAASGQTYELWIIPKGGPPLAAGTFDVDAKGTGSIGADLPRNIGDGNTAAVTNEKIGGELAPKGKIQVSGPVE